MSQILTSLEYWDVYSSDINTDVYGKDQNGVNRGLIIIHVENSCAA